MTDEQLGVTPRVARVLLTEEAIYGVILVSGMVVVAGSLGGTSADALLTVGVTVVVFYIAHAFSGALAKLAATDGHAGLWPSIRHAATRSGGLLLAAVPALVILLLGTVHAIDDTFAMWAALIVNTIVLAALGWVAVARWNTHWVWRIVSALVTAAFGAVLIVLKAVIHH